MYFFCWQCHTQLNFLFIIFFFKIKFYYAQKLKSSKGDFVTLVENDQKLLKINLSDQEISEISKPKYKKIVKKAITEEAFKDLMRQKEKHSKMTELQYSELAMQSYLKSDCILTDDEKCRVRELDVRRNYQNKYQNLQCMLCQSGEEDNQYHLFHCSKLIANLDNLSKETSFNFGMKTLTTG